MSFRQYGGTSYATRNNIVKNNFTNASNLSVMKKVGQSESIINVDSGLYMSSNITFQQNNGVPKYGIIFSDGSSQYTAITSTSEYWKKYDDTSKIYYTDTVLVGVDPSTTFPTIPNDIKFATNGNVFIGGIFNVGYITGGVSATSLFSVNGDNGNTSIGGTLSVTGNTNLSSATLASLSVTGNTNLSSATLASLSVTGNTILSSATLASLSVTGNTNLSSATLASLSVTGNTNLSSATLASLSVTGNTILSSATLASLTVTGATNTNGGLTVKGGGNTPFMSLGSSSINRFAHYPNGGLSSINFIVQSGDNLIYLGSDSDTTPGNSVITNWSNTVSSGLKWVGNTSLCLGMGGTTYPPLNNITFTPGTNSVTIATSGNSALSLNASGAATFANNLSVNGTVYSYEPIYMNGNTNLDRIINNVFYQLQDKNSLATNTGQIYASTGTFNYDNDSNSGTHTFATNNSSGVQTIPLTFNSTDLTINTTNCPTMTGFTLPLSTDNTSKIATCEWVQTAVAGGGGSSYWTIDTSGNLYPDPNSYNVCIGTTSNPTSDRLVVQGNLKVNSGDTNLNGTLSVSGSSTLANTVNVGSRFFGYALPSDSFWIGLRGSASDGDRIAIAIVGDSSGTGTVTGITMSKLTSFTTIPTAPTAAAGTNTTQLATTEFVTNAVSGGGGSVTTTVYTTSQTITISSSVKKMDFVLIGGGGGGGSNDGPNSTSGAGGGGCTFTYVNNGSSFNITLTVGAGGQGDISIGDGFPGGNSIISFSGVTVTANGGGGGKSSNTNSTGGSYSNALSGINGTSGTTSVVGTQLLSYNFYGKGGLRDGSGTGGSAGNGGVIIVTTYS